VVRRLVSCSAPPTLAHHLIVLEPIVHHRVELRHRRPLRLEIDHMRRKQRPGPVVQLTPIQSQSDRAVTTFFRPYSHRIDTDPHRSVATRTVARRPGSRRFGTCACRHSEVGSVCAARLKRTRTWPCSRAGAGSSSVSGTGRWSLFPNGSSTPSPACATVRSVRVESGPGARTRRPLARRWGCWCPSRRRCVCC
jgi:hypothetical protein